MRTIRLRPGFLALSLALVLALCAASESALARRGGHWGGRHHHGSRVAVGVFLAAPAYRYVPAPAYLPPVVVAPAAPPVYYIERDDLAPAAAQAAGGWWYYCAQSGAYYPQVKECAQQWQQVAAEPPANR